MYLQYVDTLEKYNEAQYEKRGFELVVTIKKYTVEFTVYREGLCNSRMVAKKELNYITIGVENLAKQMLDSVVGELEKAGTND
jgi:hypothetical protein